MQPRREKEDRRRARRWPRAVLSACVAVSAGCGAKTGLTVPCSIEVVTTKPEIVLVLDRSNSMSEQTRDGTTLIDAVKRATTTVLPQFDDAGVLGLIMFPSTNDFACGAEAQFQVPLGEQTTSRVIRAVQDTSVFGLTPTYSAIALAGETLRRRAAVDPNRRRFIVLATDGGAQCNSLISRESCVCTQDLASCNRDGGSMFCLDDRRVTEEVRRLRADGIQTIVIGLAAATPADIYLGFLRDVAVAGGATGRFDTPYLSAEVPAEVERVFNQSILETSYCELTLSNGAQRMPDALVTEGMRVERGVRDGNGWDTVPTQPERIRLHGTLCQHAVSQRILSWRGVWIQRCVMYP